ncbi:MAG: SRPBCC family protein [Solirubrobacterales bacterium]
MSERPTLRMERTFAAPAARVFDAFTSVEVLRRWWHPGPDWETPEASVEPRVGGEIRVAMRDPHKDARYGGRGRFTEVDPPRRIAFSWIWEDDRDQVAQRIEIDFSERDGETTIVFTHRDLWDDDAVADHERGWGLCFDNLSQVVES